MRRVLAIALSLYLAAPLFARADMTLDTYTKLMNGSAQERVIAETYIEGVGDGYSWANTHLEQKKMPLIFCYNGTVSKQFFNKLATEAISKYLAKNGPRNVPMGLLLEYQLRATYPCK
jgi:predicted transcriptional regulator